MHRLKVLGLAMLALVAVSAVASASASAALPEYSATATLSGTSGVSTLTTVGSSTTIVCKKDKFTGTTTGSSKASTFKVTFEECEAGGAKCKTGETAGIITSEGTGTLGYISKEAKTVGVSLAPKEVVITCGVLKAKVKGTFICAVTPVNTSTTSFKQKCEVSSKGVQKISKFEGGSAQSLEATFSTTFEQAALETEEAITASVAGEIKA